MIFHGNAQWFDGARNAVQDPSRLVVSTASMSNTSHERRNSGTFALYGFWYWRDIENAV